MGVALLSFLLYVLFFGRLSCLAVSNETWPLHDDGLNKVVQWDRYSFQINGERLFLWSGEIHYWRFPVPELWEDILQKIKAAGFNAFAVYLLWSYHAPSPDKLDFENGAHDFRPLLELAKKVGLYVVFRPGPYVNAEANAGGFPLWLTTGEYGTLRNNDTRYTSAWKPYWEKLSQIVSEFQITNGGTVITFQIENELGVQWLGDPSDRVPNKPIIQYMEMLEKAARDNGINVPMQSNDPNLNTKSWSKDFSSAGGNVDVYGLDSYPSCWTCDLSVCTGTNRAYIPYKTIDYHDHFVEVSPTQPGYMAEFQGGSYHPWAGPVGGCPNNTGPDFANLYYRNNAAQGITAMSLYMLYGGTNWGGLAAPVVATSYDYSSPISESRTIGDKYAETKLIGLFFRAARDLTKTDLIGNGTQYANNPMISTNELRNPDTGAAFYVTIHANSTVGTREEFKLKVNTSIGTLIIPRKGSNIVLDGFQSKIIVTDFIFGSHRLVYSTAEVLSVSTISQMETIVLWVPTGETAEFSVKDAKSGRLTQCQGCSSVGLHPGQGELTISLQQSEGMSILEIDGCMRVIVMDRSFAYRFWATPLTNNPMAPENQTGQNVPFYR